MIKKQLSFFVFLLCFNSSVYAAELSWWKPDGPLKWDTQIQEPPQSLADVPQLDLIILDLFDTPEKTVKALRQRGMHVACYLNAGSWENWRSDAKDYPKDLIGADYQGWPGEKWIDISKIKELMPLIEHRLDLCREKGFDAVDPDNVNGFENETGFDLSASDQKAFNLWLADAAHQRGLAIGMKNTTSLAMNFAPVFDWVMIESCAAQGWCREARSFLDQDKPVLAIEYPEGEDTAAFIAESCQNPGLRGYSLIFKSPDLVNAAQGCP